MRVILAALLLATAWLSTGAAADPLTGDITKAQLEVITMTTIARFAGSDGRCPRFHVIERAVFQDMHDADIPSGMLETQEFKNAQAIALWAPWSGRPPILPTSVWLCGSSLGRRAYTSARCLRRTRRPSPPRRSAAHASLRIGAAHASLNAKPSRGGFRARGRCDTLIPIGGAECGCILG
jgi:hypothetical protein